MEAVIFYLCAVSFCMMNHKVQPVFLGQLTQYRMLEKLVVKNEFIVA